MLWNGNECGKTQGDENLKATNPITDYDSQQQPDNVECFNYLSSMITYDARCTYEIKSRIAMAKAAFNIKTLFTSK